MITIVIGLTKYPTAIYLQDHSVNSDGWRTRNIQLYDFSNGVQASCNFNNDALISRLLYSRAVLGSESRYERPIIASFVSTRFPPEFRTSLARSQKEQKNTLDLLNYPQGVVADACEDKVVFHRFTIETDFCPSTLVVDLLDSNSENLTHFITQHPSSHYVIKPTNLSLGRGVEVLQADDVIRFVKTLQEIACNSYREFYGENRQLSLWKRHIRKDMNNTFLVLQTCCPSKEVQYENQMYRPTGRAVIEVTFDDDSSILPSLNFLGSYWKFPKDAESSMSTRSLVSYVDDESPVSAIDPVDYQNIEEQLRAHLPSILLKLYSTDFNHLSSYFEASTALQRYQTALEIDQASCRNFATSNFSSILSPEIYFGELTYGGPGFSEHLSHFKHAVCCPSPVSIVKSVQEDSIVPKVASSNFFSTKNDNTPSNKLKNPVPTSTTVPDSSFSDDAYSDTMESPLAPLGCTLL